MSDFPIEWLASFIAITTSTFRAFNLGYQRESYIISIFSYIIFIFYAQKQSQIILNSFYIITGIIGAWRFKSVKKSKKKPIKKKINTNKLIPIN